MSEILKYFAKYIEDELGIHYSEHNYFQLQNRLEEIARLLGVASVENLYKQATVEISGQFKQLLLDIATNNETSFFRDHKVFTSIETNILKQHTATHGTRPIKIWSAASSTGQEALSLAILVAEFNLKTGSHLDVHILGTDISERVLTKAKHGIYTQLEVQRGLPVPYLVKYFKKDDRDNWTASPDLIKKNRIPQIKFKIDVYLSGKIRSDSLP